MQIGEDVRAESFSHSSIVRLIYNKGFYFYSEKCSNFGNQTNSPAKSCERCGNQIKNFVQSSILFRVFSRVSRAKFLEFNDCQFRAVI